MTEEQKGHGGQDPAAARPDLGEMLSSLMDGEADAFEARRVIDELARNEALQATWQRYHLVSSVMQGERIDAAAVDAEARRVRMWQGVDAGLVTDFDAAGAADEAPRRRWLGPLTGLGVAATVAFAVIFVAGQGERSAAPQIADASVATESFPVVQPVLYERPSDADIRRVRARMLHHAQHTSITNVTGAIPFVKVAAYEVSDGSD